MKCESRAQDKATRVDPDPDLDNLKTLLSLTLVNEKLVHNLDPYNALILSELKGLSLSTVSLVII